MVQSTSSRLGFSSTNRDTESLVVEMVVDDDDDDDHHRHSIHRSPSSSGSNAQLQNGADEDDSVELDLQGTNIPLSYNPFYLILNTFIPK